MDPADYEDCDRTPAGDGSNSATGLMLCIQPNTRTVTRPLVTAGNSSVDTNWSEKADSGEDVAAVTTTPPAGTAATQRLPQTVHNLTDTIQ